jgi:hypothetical protein
MKTADAWHKPQTTEKRLGNASLAKPLSQPLYIISVHTTHLLPHRRVIFHYNIAIAGLLPNVIRSLGFSEVTL